MSYVSLVLRLPIMLLVLKNGVCCEATSFNGVRVYARYPHKNKNKPFKTTYTVNKNVY